MFVSFVTQDSNRKDIPWPLFSPPIDKPIPDPIFQIALDQSLMKGLEKYISESRVAYINLSILIDTFCMSLKNKVGQANLCCSTLLFPISPIAY